MDHQLARALSLVFVLTVANVFDARGQGLGYAVAGPAGVSGFFGSSASSVHAAGGGEALVAGLVGVGAEVGALANSSNVLLVVSANGVAHLTRSRFSPFVTAGYTRMQSGEGGFNAWNAGVGADYWAGDRVSASEWSSATMCGRIRAAPCSTGRSAVE